MHNVSALKESAGYVWACIELCIHRRLIEIFTAWVSRVFIISADMKILATDGQIITVDNVKFR